MSCRHLCNALALIVSVGSVSAAQAALVTTTDSQTNGTNSLPHTYTPSNSDLINGQAPSASAGNFGNEATGGLPVLTDGAFPSPITRDAGGGFQFSSFGAGGPDAGTSATWTLTSAANLTSIVVYGGWQDGGRDQQRYDVSYSTAADPATFISLGSVNFNPADPSGHPQVTRVTLTDTTGTLASNVKAIKFDFPGVENNHTGYAEIDVIGTVVPEPTSLSLLCLGGLGLLARRRKA